MKQSREQKDIERLDSEFEEDEQQFQAAKKLQEKQHEIDDLSKKIRYIELDFKKKEIETKAELANEKQRVQELQDLLQKKLALIRENKQADELQQKLSEVENDLFEKQQIAHAMLMQLTQMEQENISLREEIDKMKMSQYQNAGSNQDIDIDKLLNKCLQLEKEKEDLIRDIEQIKSGAIDTIVEKEKTIIQLQEIVEELRIQAERQEGDNEGDLSSAMSLQLERMHGEWESKLVASEERNEELSKRIDDLIIQHQEQLLSLEKELNEKVYVNIQEHINTVKNAEADLLQQLQMSEEKNKRSEKLLSDLQKLSAMQKEEQARQKDQIEIKSRQVNKMQEQLESAKNQIKDLEEQYRLLSKELSDKNHLIEKQNVKRDEQVKMMVNLEAENKRIKENLEINKTTILNLESQLDSLTEKLEEVQHSMNMQLKVISENYEKERADLLEDFKRLQQQESLHKLKSWKKTIEISGEESLESAKIEEYVVIHEEKQNPIIGQKPAAKTLESIKNSTEAEKLNQSQPVVNEQEKNNDSSINPPNKQTLLGLEFEDEDFSIEEEKTDSIENNRMRKGSKDINSSILGISGTPDKKSMSNNSSGVKDKQKDFYQESFNLTNQRNSTRNQFKKQFLLPHNNNNGPNSSNNNNNNSNVSIVDLENENAELKKQIIKLEKSIDSYNIQKENLTQEYKNTLKQLQESRREKIMSNSEADLINELNSFKEHCHRVETQFVTQKLQLTEELHFFKEEAKIFEKQSNENRDQLMKMNQDKDYFQQKYTQLKHILKQRKTGGSLGGGQVLFPESIDVLQQQQNQNQQQKQSVNSKKKTFWIFK